MRPSGSSPLNVFRESVRDKVLYNLVLFAVLLMAASFLHRPADGRPGRQDHQGPRPGGDLALRPVHRRVHRHRPGLEGGRAAQRLQPAREAGPPARSSSSASTSAWRSRWLVNVAVMTVALYAVLAYMNWRDRRTSVARGVGGARRSTRAAEGVPADLRRAAAGDGRSRCSSRPSRARCCRPRSPSASTSSATSTPT